MRLTDYLTTELCVMDLKSSSKEGAIRELASVLASTGKVSDNEDFIKHLMEREKLGSTGIGNHIAIPHTPTKSVESLAMAFGRSRDGIDFQSLDGEEVNLVFLMGTNPDNLNVYLKLLATLSKLLSDRLFREEFMAASSADKIIELFRRYEK